MAHAHYFGSRRPTEDDGELGDYFLDVSLLHDLRLILYGPKQAPGLGQRQIQELQVIGAPTVDGDLQITFESELTDDIELEFPVEAGASGAAVALALAAFLQEHETIGLHYDFSIKPEASNRILITAHLPAENDDGLNVEIDHGEVTGITDSESETTTLGEFASYTFPGVAQVETATVVGTITTSGNLSITVTLAGVPTVIPVAVLEDDDPEDVALKIKDAILAAMSAAFEDVSAVVGGNVVLQLAPAENDATLNVAIANGTAAGLTEDATSTNTTAGVAPIGLGAQQKEVLTIEGTVSESGSVQVVVTAADLPGSPITLNIPVEEDDEPEDVGDKIATFIGAGVEPGTEAIGEFFNVDNLEDWISFTRAIPAANDPTISIAISNGTAAGLTSATSVNTTVGVEPQTYPWLEVRRYCHGQILQTTLPLEAALAEFAARSDSPEYLLWVRDDSEPPVIYGPKGFFGWNGEPYENIES